MSVPDEQEKPMTIRCPACGHEGKLRDDIDPLPRRVRCRHCGELFETGLREKVSPPLEEVISQADAAADRGVNAQSEDGKQAIETRDGNVADLGIDVSDELPDRDLSLPGLPPDPGYYQVFYGFGVVCFVASAFLIGGLGLGILAAIVARANDLKSDLVGLSFMNLVAMGFAAVPLVTVGALMLLLVDQARNVSHMNHRLERMEMLIMRAMKNHD
jgi:hypothetical protein